MQCIVRIKVLSDSLSSQEIATMIGIYPDRSWNIGDLRPKTRFKEKTHGIIIDSGVDWSNSIENHLKALIAKVEPVRKQFLAIAEICTMHLSIVYYSDFNPGLWFDSPLIKFLSEINAGIDIEGYVLDAELVEMVSQEK